MRMSSIFADAFVNSTCTTSYGTLSILQHAVSGSESHQWKYSIHTLGTVSQFRSERRCPQRRTFNERVHSRKVRFCKVLLAKTMRRFLH